MSSAAFRAGQMGAHGSSGFAPFPELHVTLAGRPFPSSPFGLPHPVPPQAGPAAPIPLEEDAPLTELDEPFLEADPAAHQEGAAAGKAEEKQKKKGAGWTRPRPNSIEGALAGVGGPDPFRTLFSLLPEAGASQAALLRAGQVLGGVAVLAPLMVTADELDLPTPHSDGAAGLGAAKGADPLHVAGLRAPPGSGGSGPGALEFHIAFPPPAPVSADGFSSHVALWFDPGQAGVPHGEAPDAGPQAPHGPAPEPSAPGWRPPAGAEAAEQPRGSAAEAAAVLVDATPAAAAAAAATDGARPGDAAPPAPVLSVFSPALSDAGPSRPAGPPLPWLEPPAAPPAKAPGAGNGKGTEPSPVPAAGLPEAVPPQGRGPGHRAEAAADGPPANEAAAVVALPAWKALLAEPPGHAKHDGPEPAGDAGPPGLGGRLPPGLADGPPGKAKQHGAEAEPAAAAVMPGVEAVGDGPAKGKAIGQPAWKALSAEPPGHAKHDGPEPAGDAGPPGLGGRPPPGLADGPPGKAKQHGAETEPAAAVMPGVEAVGNGSAKGKAIGHLPETAQAHIIPATPEAVQSGAAPGKPLKASLPAEAMPPGRPQEETGTDASSPLPHPVHLEPPGAAKGKGPHKDGPSGPLPSPVEPTILPEHGEPGHGKQPAAGAEPALVLVLPEIPGGAAMPLDLTGPKEAKKAAGLGAAPGGGGPAWKDAPHGAHPAEPVLPLHAKADKPFHGPPFSAPEQDFDAAHPVHPSMGDWHL